MTAPADLSARATASVEPTGIVDLLTTTVPGRSTGSDLPRDTFDDGEVGGAALGLRRLHADEHELGAGRRLLRADDEAQPPRLQAFEDERGQALLEDRHLTFRQPAHPRFVEVGADDVMAQVREARRGRDPHVPRTDHRDVTHRAPPKPTCVNKRGIAPQLTQVRGARAS